MSSNTTDNNESQFIHEINYFCQGRFWRKRTGIFPNILLNKKRETFRDQKMNEEKIARSLSKYFLLLTYAQYPHTYKSQCQQKKGQKRYAPFSGRQIMEGGDYYFPSCLVILQTTSQGSLFMKLITFVIRFWKYTSLPMLGIIWNCFQYPYYRC